jgi:hypothetical protein
LCPNTGRKGTALLFYIDGCWFISAGVVSDIRILLWKEKRFAEARSNQNIKKEIQKKGMQISS